MRKIQITLILTLMLASFIACNLDQKVMLPQGETSEIVEMKDHSPIYIFYKTSNNDTIAEVNKNNIISTTNWIFNIDKRLPLQKVVPELVTFFKKKRGASTHKNEESAMYFSYSDSVHQNLAFSPIKNTEYSEKIYHSKMYIKQYPKFHIPYENVSIDFKKNGKIIINDQLISALELKKYIQDFIVFSSENRPILLYLNFDEAILYGDYLKNKLLINSLLQEDKIYLSKQEFIYDSKQLPAICNCVTQ